jgi:hypothetical protein
MNENERKREPLVAFWPDAMNSPTFRLLQNEGFLMQGCFKSSIPALMKSSYSQRGPLYVSLFNFSIALERLLKVALILHHHLRNAGGFPDKRTLQNYGHKIQPLYVLTERLFGSYGVKVAARCRLDEIDKGLMHLLDSFAVSGRYFNLDALAGGGSDDPLVEWNNLLTRIYEKDVSRSQRVAIERQVTESAALTKPFTSVLQEVGLDGCKQSYEDLCHSAARMEAALPHVVWRLVKILIPLKDLVVALRERLHEPAFPNRGQIPFMEEFLDFVVPDRRLTIGDPNWPFWD